MNRFGGRCLAACSVVLASGCVMTSGPSGKAADSRVKVFILAGQSNMEGHGHVTWGANPARTVAWCEENGEERHFAGGRGSLRYEVDTKSDTYGRLVDAKGDWVVRDDVWITWTPENADEKRGALTVGFGADAETIGPEFGFGHVVGDALDAPVLIIKTAWGGKSLAEAFRSPRAVAKRGGAVGPYYTLMMAQVKAALANLSTLVPGSEGRGYTLAGFGWHQGWNDGCDREMTAMYEQNMADFIHDVRRDLGSPDLPFVIGGSGFGGEQWCKGNMLRVLEAQLAMADPQAYPLFKGNVAAVDTRPFNRSRIPAFGQGYHWHWNGETHYLIGESMGNAMLELMDSAN